MENPIVKTQLTRDLKDDTSIYQGIRLPCKKYHGYCDPTTRTQATFVWFPEDTCTTFQIARIHASMIKIHHKNFIESIHYDKVNPENIRLKDNRYININGMENKLTRFQNYPETELACKYKTPI